MKTYLTKAELKLMEVIWEKGQIPSNKLVKECLERFNWKKSTTYTNLKKLVDKKMVCNSEAVITVLKSRADYENGQRKEFITAICPFVYQRKKSDKRRYSRIGESNRRI